MSLLPSFTIDLSDIVSTGNSGQDSDSKKMSAMAPGDQLTVQLGPLAAPLFSFANGLPVTYNPSQVSGVVGAQISADGKSLVLTAANQNNYYYTDVQATFYFTKLSDGSQHQHDPLIPKIGVPQ